MGDGDDSGRWRQWSRTNYFALCCWCGKAWDATDQGVLVTAMAQHETVCRRMTP